MSNYTFGTGPQSAGGLGDSGASSMRLTINTLPSLEVVKVTVAVTSLSGAVTIYNLTSTGTTVYSNARAVAVRVEPLYNDGYSANSITGSVQSLNSGGSVLGTASISDAINVLQNVNFVKDDVGSDFGDSLVGDANANDLIGRGGDDVLAGSLGNDRMDGGAGNDSVDYRLSNAAVTVTLGGSVSGGHAQGDTLVSIENVWGSAYADTLTGDAGSNRLEGNAGNDTLNGAGGADILVGGDGNDVLNGGIGADEMVGNAGDDLFLVDNAGDIIFEDSGGGADTVQTVLASYTLANEVETLQFTGSGAFAGTGNALANTITGGAGNDTLNGLGGSDVLTGGGGSDHFVFSTAPGAGNIDSITDFVVGTDRIDLDDAIFTALTVGSLPAGAFATGNVAADADDHILYDPVTGALYYDADGAGGADAVQFATLSAGLTLSATDFGVI